MPVETKDTEPPIIPEVVEDYSNLPATTVKEQPKKQSTLLKNLKTIVTAAVAGI